MEVRLVAIKSDYLSPAVSLYPLSFFANNPFKIKFRPNILKYLRTVSFEFLPSFDVWLEIGRLIQNLGSNILEGNYKRSNV